MLGHDDRHLTRWTEANAAHPETIAAQLGLENAPKKRKRYGCPVCNSRDNLGWFEAKRGEAPYRWHCFTPGCVSGPNIDFVAAVEGVEARDAVTLILGDDGGTPWQGAPDGPKRVRAPKPLGFMSPRQLEQDRAEFEDAEFWAVEAGCEPVEYEEPLHPQNAPTFLEVAPAPAFVTTARDVTRTEAWKILPANAYRLLTALGTDVCVAGTGTGKTFAWMGALVEAVKAALEFESVEAATAERAAWMVAKDSYDNAERNVSIDRLVGRRVVDLDDIETLRLKRDLDDAMKARHATPAYRALLAHGQRFVWLSPFQPGRDDAAELFAKMFAGDSAMDRDMAEAITHVIKSADEEGCDRPWMRNQAVRTTGKASVACDSCPRRADDTCPVFKGRRWRSGVVVQFATHKMHSDIGLEADIMVCDESPIQHIAKERKGLRPDHVEAMPGTNALRTLATMRKNEDDPRDDKRRLRVIRGDELIQAIGDDTFPPVDSAVVGAHLKDIAAKAEHIIGLLHGADGDQRRVLRGELAAMPDREAILALLRCAGNGWQGADIKRGFITLPAPKRDPWDSAAPTGPKSLTVLDANATIDAENPYDVRALFGPHARVDKATNLRLIQTQHQRVTWVRARASKGVLSSDRTDIGARRWEAAHGIGDRIAGELGGLALHAVNKSDQSAAKEFVAGHVEHHGSKKSRGSNDYQDCPVLVIDDFYCNHTEGVFNLAGAMAQLAGANDDRDWEAAAAAYLERTWWSQMFDRIRFGHADEARPKHAIAVGKRPPTHHIPWLRIDETICGDDAVWACFREIGQPAWRAKKLRQIVESTGGAICTSYPAQNMGDSLWSGSPYCSNKRIGGFTGAPTTPEIRTFMRQIREVQRTQKLTWTGFAQSAELGIELRPSSESRSGVIFAGDIAEDDVRDAIFAAGVEWYETPQGERVLNPSTSLILALASVDGLAAKPRMEVYAAVGAALGVSADAARSRIKRGGGLDAMVDSLSPQILERPEHSREPRAVAQREDELAEAFAEFVVDALRGRVADAGDKPTKHWLSTASCLQNAPDIETAACQSHRLQTDCKPTADLSVPAELPKTMGRTDEQRAVEAAQERKLGVEGALDLAFREACELPLRGPPIPPSRPVKVATRGGPDAPTWRGLTVGDVVSGIDQRKILAALDAVQRLQAGFVGAACQVALAKHRPETG